MRCRFFQKTNKQICFVCFFAFHGKQNKFVRLFFGWIYGAPKLLLVLSDLDHRYILSKGCKVEKLPDRWLYQVLIWHSDLRIIHTIPTSLFQTKWKSNSLSHSAGSDFHHCIIKDEKEMNLVVYMCSSLLQLALGSCDLSQAERRSCHFEWIWSALHTDYSLLSLR